MARKDYPTPSCPGTLPRTRFWCSVLAHLPARGSLGGVLDPCAAWTGKSEAFRMQRLSSMLTVLGEELARAHFLSAPRSTYSRKRSHGKQLAFRMCARHVETASFSKQTLLSWCNFQIPLRLLAKQKYPLLIVMTDLCFVPSCGSILGNGNEALSPF